MKKIILFFVLLILCGCSIEKQADAEDSLPKDHDSILLVKDDEKSNLYQIFTTSKRYDRGYFTIDTYKIKPHEKPYDMTLTAIYKKRKLKEVTLHIPASKEDQIV